MVMSEWGKSSYPALSRVLTKAVSRQVLKLIFELIVSVISLVSIVPDLTEPGDSLDEGGLFP